MEKKEALKEWCIEQAVEICKGKSGHNVLLPEEDVLQVARKLEEYVIGCERPTDVPDTVDNYGTR